MYDGPKEELIMNAETLSWLITMIPVSALFTGIGIFAWRRKKPMWFWSGTTVSEEEISNVPTYNRANGIMWIAYSAIYWASTILGLAQIKAGAICLTVGAVAGIPALIVAYSLIYARFRRK